MRWINKHSGSTLLVILLTLIHFQFAMAQNLELQANHQPLNQVLYALSFKNSCSISFDDQLLSHHIITIDTTCNNLDDALLELLKNTNLHYEKIGDVYILYPKKKLYSQPPDSIIFTGTIYDLNNYEPLPYSQLIINKQLIYANDFGHFAVLHPHCDSLNITISYLGYSGIDTTLNCSKLDREQEFFLKPTLVHLSEVTVRKDIAPDQPMIGMETGKLNINQRIANYLPGTGDNAIDRFLGLMPGLQNSTSQGGKISIWGSDPNRTEYDFDGFRIYNPDHFYGHIGVINDLTIKSVQVQKGTGSAANSTSNFGQIKIIGKAGNRIRPSATAEMNNLTTNLLFETPAGARNTLLLAARALYRHPENTVYFRQFNLDQQLQHGDNDLLDQEESVHTNYLFGDILMKFSGAIGAKQNYYISLYQSYDENNFNSDSTQNSKIPFSQTNNRWGNSGAVAYFSQKPNKNFSYDIKAALSSNFETNQSTINFKGDEFRNALNIDGEGEKQLWDFSIKNTYDFLLKKHQLKTGFGFNNYQIKNRQLNSDTLVNDDFCFSFVPYFFLQDKYYLGNQTHIDLGGRLDYASLSKYLSFAPNVSMIHSFGKGWSIGLNTGRTFNHVLKVQSVFDLHEVNNLSYWELADGQEIKVEQTDLLSTSLNYQSNRLQAYFELYVKKIEGLTERINTRATIEIPGESIPSPGIELEYLMGKASISGISCYFQYTLNNFMLWGAYDYNHADKQFDEWHPNEKIAFGYNHQHEAKAALLWKTGLMVWSSTIKYGSGYNMEPIMRQERPEWFTRGEIPFFRWDASVVYSFNRGKLNTTVGASLMNITNYDNLRFQQINNGIKPASGLGNIYYEINAMRRTLTAFVRIKI